MEPNQGTTVGDLRVLLPPPTIDKQRWYWWLLSFATLFHVLPERYRYELRVMSASTSNLLAVRTFGRAAHARHARERFVALAARSGVNAADPVGVQALLDSVPID